MKKIVIGVVVALVLIVAIGSCSGAGDEGQQAEEPSSTVAAVEEISTAETAPAGLEYGELLDETEGEGVIVLKAKIKPQANNKLTIDQNYYNVDDYVKSRDMDGVEELQYWAVADMSSGDEQKVVSFTVDKATIDDILAGNIVANQMGDYVTDLWVHPSLR